jgi:4-hydroxy-tetrahydrodipicolinate synthase
MAKKRLSEAQGIGRRDFLKTILASAATVSLSGLSLPHAGEANTGIPRPQTADDWKPWAREYFKGVENETLPSFTQDLKYLNETGIRLDVRQAIRHGFHSTLCTSEAGLTLDEAIEFVAIVADEAGDQLLPSTTILFDTFDMCFQMLEHAAQSGCSHVLLGYPPKFRPQSATEIYDITADMIQTADIGIILYPHHDFPGISGDDIDDIIDDLANFPNVIAGKFFDPLGPSVERYGDRLLISSPLDASAVSNVENHGMRWIGAGPYEYLQSPENPYFTTMFDHALNGRFDEAYALNDFLKPVSTSFMMRHMPQVANGLYSWPQHKYYQWCTGGNGGFTRQPVLRLMQKDMDAIKDAYREIGITPPASDEGFFVGRT